MQYSIVNLSEVKNVSNDFLLHAEFFNPKIQKFREYAKNNNFQKLENYVDYIKNGVQPNYKENGIIPVIRPVNIQKNEITSERQEYITENFYNKNLKGQIKYNDVLVTASGIGTLGRSIIFKERVKKFLSVDNIILRNLKELSPEFLYIYLNSKYGQEQINVLYKGTSGIIHLYPDDIKQILIKPLNIQKEITTLVNTSYSLRQSANNLYQEAENILLEELGLKDYIPQNKKCFTKKLSDTQKAGRFDAEYFQPKYEDIIEKIKEYRGGYDLLKNISNIKKCIEPGSSEYKEYGISFIRVSNLNKFEINNNNQQYVSQLFYENNLEHQPKKNEILLSKDGTLGIAYCLYKEPKKMICSSGIVRLTDIKIKPLCLTLILNSILSQMQIKQKSGGALIVHWLTNDVKNLLIPLLSPSIQSIISTKIQESFANREKSKQLLEIAKRSVEIAIEENEEKGLDYIKNNDC